MLKRVNLIFVLILLLTGCWDQNLLKEVSLINCVSFDLEDNNKISFIVSMRTLLGSEGGVEGKKSKTLTMKEIGSTPRRARDLIDLKTSKKVDGSKLQVLLVGESLAKKEFYPTMDIFYRDPKNALNAKVAIVEGRAEDVINIGRDSELIVGQYLFDLLSSAEDATMSKNNDMQSIGTIILDPGQDIVIPFIQYADSKTAKVKGVALFDGKNYSGKNLNRDDTVLFHLLMDHLSNTARFTKKIYDTDSIKNFITIDITHLKRNLSINTNNPSNIIVDLKIIVKAKIVEYPHDELDSQKEIMKINKILSKQLTKQAKRVTDQLQEANCDGLGIGRRMIALHHKVWQELDWDSTYPTISINPEVKVKIIQKGIIN